MFTNMLFIVYLYYCDCIYYIIDKTLRCCGKLKVEITSLLITGQLPPKAFQQIGRYKYRLTILVESRKSRKSRIQTISSINRTQCQHR